MILLVICWDGKFCFSRTRNQRDLTAMMAKQLKPYTFSQHESIVGALRCIVQLKLLSSRSLLFDVEAMICPQPTNELLQISH